MQDERTAVLENALRVSRDQGLRVWERANHWHQTLKEIRALSGDPIIHAIVDDALTFQSNKPI